MRYLINHTNKEVLVVNANMIHIYKCQTPIQIIQYLVWLFTKHHIDNTNTDNLLSNLLKSKSIDDAREIIYNFLI